MKMRLYNIIRSLLLLLFLTVGNSLQAQEEVFDPVNPPDPNPTYKLTTLATPREMAAVSGTGRYKTGDRVYVNTSSLDTDYEFKYWEKDGEMYSNSRSFYYTIGEEDVTLTAVYGLIDFDPANPIDPNMSYEWRLYLAGDPEEACSFNLNNGSRHAAGDRVEVRAYASQGFEFDGWYDEDEQLLATSLSFEYVMPDNNATLTARFTFNPSSPVDPVSDGSQDGIDLGWEVNIYDGNGNAITVPNISEALRRETTENALFFVDGECASLPDNFVAEGRANCIALTDAKPFYSPEDVEAEQISYTRSFPTATWQALYLPFEMVYDDWKDLVDIAEFYNVHQYDTDGDGKTDKTTVEFFTLGEGQSTQAHTPYLVRPKAAGPVTLTAENTMLWAVPEAEGFVDCMSTKAYYKICGIYQTKSDLYANREYAVTQDGKFALAASDRARLSPFRIYLHVDNRSGAGSMNRLPAIGISVDGEETTAVEGIAADEERPAACYDLQGRRVEKPAKGLYIMNGKKVLFNPNQSLESIHIIF